MSDESYSTFVNAYTIYPDPPPLKQVQPHEARPILKRMLDPNPKTRASTVEVLRDKWVMRLKSSDTVVRMREAEKEKKEKEKLEKLEKAKQEKLEKDSEETEKSKAKATEKPADDLEGKVETIPVSTS